MKKTRLDIIMEKATEDPALAGGMIELLARTMIGTPQQGKEAVGFLVLLCMAFDAGREDAKEHPDENYGPLLSEPKEKVGNVNG